MWNVHNSISWRHFACKDSGCSSYLPTVTVSVENCREDMSWSHHYFPSGKAEMILPSLLNNFAAKGGCRQVPEQCLREGSQRGLRGGCEAGAGLLLKRAARMMKEEPEPEGLIWVHPGIKERAHLVLMGLCTGEFRCVDFSEAKLMYLLWSLRGSVI